MSIDLGKFKSVSCFYEVRTLHEKYDTIKTTPQEIHDLVITHNPDVVVFEACSVIGWICDLLETLGVKYLVANTNADDWQGKRLKRKTDKKDALWLAKRTATGGLPVIYVPEKEVREKRAFIKQRKSIVERLTQCKNSIHSILDKQATPWPSGKKGWSKSRIAELKQMSCTSDKASLGELWRVSLWAELLVYERLEELLLEMDLKLEELNQQDSQVQLLKTIPGVGDRLAEAVVAYIDDPHRFKNCKQVSCYVGMTPRQYQSGIIDRYGRISKDGNKLLRSLLVEVSWIAMRWNPWVKETYERIKRGSKTRSRIAIVAVARRLFVRMWAMMRDGTEWSMPGCVNAA